MNLTQLKSWMSRFTGDFNQTRYSAQNYLDAINEAQVQFCMDSRALFKDQVISVVSGQSSYPLNSDFMYEKKATLSTLSNTTAGIVLTPISRSQLEFSTVDHDWTQDTGTPKFFMIDPATQSGFDGAFVLYPQPQGADAGTNNCILTYYPYPALLANPTDVPLNGTGNLVQFHIGLASYASYLLLSGEVSTPEITTKMATLKKRYEDQVAEALDRYGNTPSAGIKFTGGRYWH